MERSENYAKQTDRQTDKYAPDQSMDRGCHGSTTLQEKELSVRAEVLEGGEGARTPGGARQFSSCEGIACDFRGWLRV